MNPPQQSTAKKQPCKANAGQTGLSATVLMELAVQGMQNAAFFLVDPQGVIISWNSGAERIFGYRDIEVSGHQAAYFFPEIETLGQTLQVPGAADETRQELRLKNRHGRPFRVEAVARALRNEQGVLLGVSYLAQDIGKRKSKDAQIQQSEWHFRQLVENAPGFIWMTDLESKVTYANQTWKDFIGASFEGSLELAYRGILHPDDLTMTMELCTKALAAHQPWELECQLRGADGEYRWLHYNAVPQLTQEGQFCGFIGVGFDITEHKQAEQALKESEARLRALTDDIPVLLWMADANTRLIHANQAYCEFFGQRLEEMIGQVSSMAAHPDDLQELTRIYGNAVQEKKPYSLECRIRRWDSEYRWFLYRGVPRLMPNGDLLGFIGIGIDITERKNAELALLESEARFRTLADVSPVMIWLNDEQANLVYANKGLLAFFGQPFNILAHRGWEPYIHPEDLGKVCVHLENAFKTHNDFNLEFRVKQADGQFRWILSRGAARFREDGKFLGQVGTWVDITELRKAREALESKVNERTRQLETLNKELEAFAYSVSHDLRAPLRSIDGFSRILISKAGDRLTEEEQRYLGNVCENTQRMGELIDDLLQLSRLSRAEMACEDVDLGAMGTSILQELQKQEPQRLVRFQVAEGMVVHGDASLLKILLENLLSNAWKFTGKVAEAEIEMGVIRQGDKPVYYVRDNGAGFNMKYVDKLFGPFQRLHRMDEFPGNGIGLATVQRILQRHGGKAWAEGQVGKGATFYFSL